jgi:hypothetical protein
MAFDAGQWDSNDPVVKWYKSLMQPDVPGASCCGEADAYWADETHVRDGKVYAVITDPRDLTALGRPQLSIGTEFEVPQSKVKWGPTDPDKTPSKNPTGHTVVFISRGGYVFCYVPDSGI